MTLLLPETSVCLDATLRLRQRVRHLHTEIPLMSEETQNKRSVRFYLTVVKNT